MSTQESTGIGNDESKNDTPDVSQTLEALLTKIDQLDSPSDTRKIISAIASNSDMKYALLNENNIDDGGAASIGEGLIKNTTLHDLYLAQNNIGDGGAASIGEGLTKNVTLQELFFDENHIGYGGAASIGEGLTKNAALQKLSLDDNNIGDNGAAAICEGLRKNTTLKTLRLSRNNIGDGGAASIGEVLTKNATLQELYLNRNTIGGSGAASIVEGLTENATLQDLHLRRNNIGDGGAASIGEWLTKNATLQELYLTKNNIGGDGAAAIAEGLSKNITLRVLSIDQNNIGDGGAASIGEGLTKNATLKRLCLQGNNIGDGGAAAIGEGLSENATLEVLHLNGNQMTHAGLLSLAKGFRFNKTLTLLDADPKGTEYELTYQIKNIGSGEFGSVRLASTKKSKKEVVEKISHGTSHHEEIYERLILQGLPDHKNVVLLAALSADATLLLEPHKGGSLKDYAINHEDGVPLQQFSLYSHGMSLAIAHLHEHGIVHRDIALRNYVLTEDLQTPVLVDFGLSWPIEEEKCVTIRHEEKMPWRQCAPEVLSMLQYSKASDIWQLGLAFWQLLQRGRRPFFEYADGQELVERLHKKMVQEKAPIPLPFRKNGASRALIDAVKEVVVYCCRHDPAERPMATQVVEKIESLRGAVDVSADEEKEMVKYVPDKKVVDDGLMAYNYTDYQQLDNAGRSEYIDLAKELEEYQKLEKSQQLDKSRKIDVEEDVDQDQECELGDITNA